MTTRPDIPMIRWDRNVLFTQAWNCLVYVQIGYTAVFIGRSLGRKSPLLRIYIAAPKKGKDYEYRRTRWGISRGKPSPVARKVAATRKAAMRRAERKHLR